nr:zinc finger protein 358 isoform X1 [Helicoverpa armigera]
MAAEVMKLEVEMETCCVCGGGGELLSPEEHDAGAPPMQVPLRTMLVHLNSSKVVPEGRLCGSCIRRTMESYEFSTALSSRGVPPLSEKIRALRRRLHELTQKIDVFIVVGGAGAGGAYSEEDIIMVERESLAAAAAADDAELQRARNARGDHVYQCSVCPQSFPRLADFRAHAAAHPAAATHCCWTCGAQFPGRAALRQHAARACAALACQLCGRAAAGPAELRRHEAACPPRCPACALLLADRAALAAHCAALHGRGARPPLVCAQCFRTCDTPELLSAHMLRHRQAKQFVCGYDGCILRFATRANLMAHIRKCHAGDLPEPEPAPAPEEPAPTTTCEHCGRTFGSVAAMKRHARVHRGRDSAPAPQVRTHVHDVPRAAPCTDEPRVQDEGADSPEGEDMEGEVEYLEVDELDDADQKPMLMQMD